MELPEALLKLHREILTCKRCPLHLYRTNAVPGEGGFRKKVMIVGEAPGKKEDETGRPFVGIAGRLLEQALSYAGLTRNDVYITNVVKCRPPRNRDPKEPEIKACTTYLERQVEILNPKIIVSLGRISYMWFSKKYGLPQLKISEARGKIFDVGSRKLLVTYHPAATIYNRTLRDVFIKDILLLKNIIDNL